MAEVPQLAAGITGDPLSRGLLCVCGPTEPSKALRGPPRMLAYLKGPQLAPTGHTWLPSMTCISRHAPKSFRKLCTGIGTVMHRPEELCTGLCTPVDNPVNIKLDFSSSSCSQHFFLEMETFLQLSSSACLYKVQTFVAESVTSRKSAKVSSRNTRVWEKSRIPARCQRQSRLLQLNGLSSHPLVVNIVWRIILNKNGKRAGPVSDWT